MPSVRLALAIFALGNAIMAFLAYREYRGLIEYCEDSFEVQQGGDRFSCVEPGGWFAVMVEVLSAALLEIGLLVVVGAAVVHWWSKTASHPGGTVIDMPRPPKDDDATKDLKPEDETQRAKAGTKIGKLRKSEVMADFKKVARGKD